MNALTEVRIGAFPLDRFRPILGERYAEVEEAIGRAKSLFDGRAVWNVNSTARGGGVAELLQSLLAYSNGAGVDTRWEVISGDAEFFAITKRIHNHLHGSDGDGGGLGNAERAAYERTLVDNARELAARVRPHDVVVLHDPQTAGMVEAVRETGAIVIWRCHVGLDLPNDQARAAWDFLRPFVAGADGYVFSRDEFVWEGIDRDRVLIVPPSIDAFSPKNQDLTPEATRAILARVGIGDGGGDAGAAFTREDGSPGRVDREAELVQSGPVPADAQLVTQVSRWDRLKDPVGVLEGFALVEHPKAHLLLAGPSVAAVADDPEGAEVLAEVHAAHSGLPPEVAERVHLASLPMDDPQENAAMVNAIQRRSDIVVQKSLAEGFGLTVSEAMWKSRPVVASGLGGIQDQIVDRESGILLKDPTDLDSYARALDELLSDGDKRDRMGAAARKRVEDGFLGPRHLIQYLELIASLIARREG